MKLLSFTFLFKWKWRAEAGIAFFFTGFIVTLHTLRVFHVHTLQYIQAFFRDLFTQLCISCVFYSRMVDFDSRPAYTVDWLCLKFAPQESVLCCSKCAVGASAGSTAIYTVPLLQWLFIPPPMYSLWDRRWEENVTLQELFFLIPIIIIFVWKVYSFFPSYEQTEFNGEHTMCPIGNFWFKVIMKN